MGGAGNCIGPADTVVIEFVKPSRCAARVSLEEEDAPYAETICVLSASRGGYDGRPLVRITSERYDANMGLLTLPTRDSVVSSSCLSLGVLVPLMEERWRSRCEAKRAGIVPE
jgi:hypothetical protein